MPTLTIIGKFTVDVDDEGYLTNSAQWTREIAAEIAKLEGIATLTDRHLIVINFLRRIFALTGATPNNHRIAHESGVDTKELHALFPGDPARIAAKIAGVRKPSSCV